MGGSGGAMKFKCSAVRGALADKGFVPSLALLHCAQVARG